MTGSRESILQDLGDVKSALRMSFDETAKLYGNYLNAYVAWISRFLGFRERMVRAEGGKLFDEKGNVYLDFLCGFGALNLGHEPPEVLEALREVERFPNILQSYLNPCAAKLAQYLVRLTDEKLSRVFFCSSGTEACEAALKLARAASKQRLLVYAEGAYHGKTLGALAVSGREKYKTPFGPLMPETAEVPYDDIRALEEVFRQKEPAAFIVEPVQGEAGVIVPRLGYLQGVRRLCDRYGVYLIFDEVQTGVGRTGKFFCFEHEGVCPDILTLSKSLGGGVMPLGAMVAANDIWQKAYGVFERALLHSSTFGGNTRACACGIAAVRTVLSKDLCAHAAEMGQYFLKGLNDLCQRHPLLAAVRGKGLMIGLSLARLKGDKKLTEGAFTIWAARQLLRRHRIITAFTFNNYDVLRLAPPLAVSREDADYFLNALEDVLKAAEKFRFFRIFKEEART